MPLTEDDTGPAAVTGAAAGPGRRYGAAAGPGRRFTPDAPPRDLQEALAPIADYQYGSKIFENLGVQDINPELVKSVGDLLLLRSYFLTQLGQRLGWLIKLSVTEWPTLSYKEKKIHTAMRKAFLTSYVFGAETIIQHWFWKTLKTAPKSFGLLLSVFADDYDASAAMTPRRSSPSTWLVLTNLSPSFLLSSRCRYLRFTPSVRSWASINLVYLATSAPTANL